MEKSKSGQNNGKELGVNSNGCLPNVNGKSMVSLGQMENKTARLNKSENSRADGTRGVFGGRKEKSGNIRMPFNYGGNDSGVDSDGRNVTGEINLFNVKKDQNDKKYVINLNNRQSSRV